MVDKIKRAVFVDYTGMDDTEKKAIYDVYLLESVHRLGWVAGIIFVAELILMILDIRNGTFRGPAANELNLVAELVVIVSSLLMLIADVILETKDIRNTQLNSLLIISYKMMIFFGVCLFIFTDTHIHLRTMGTYLVFMFIFQIIPFYRMYKNFLIYLAFASMVAVTYVISVPKVYENTLFSAMLIYVAFFLSTECLRIFFTKKLVNNMKSQILASSFENLATQTITALVTAVEAKDQYTRGHSQRVAIYAREIAKRYGFDEDKQGEGYYIGLLHDIGKIGIPDYIINKDGHLTDEEYEMIKKHPEVGYDILKDITELEGLAQGANWHHERYDGSGYPDGLIGDNIPLIAQIVSVADAYDAMTSKRSYRDVLPQSVVRAEFEKSKGKQFRGDLAQIMIDMIDEDVDYKLHE